MEDKAERSISFEAMEKLVAAKKPLLGRRQKMVIKTVALLTAASVLGYFLAVHSVPLGDWIETAVRWLRINLGGLFDFISTVIKWMADRLETLLLWPPSVAICAVFGLLGWWARRMEFGVFAILGFLFIDSMLLWKDAMSTLSLVLVASIIAIAIGIPLGILAGKSGTAGAAFKPMLDFMQTMPAFVYLIPAIFFFGIGKVPGIVATVIFAMPPSVRLTELGIRQVDEEVVEAAEAFGATKNQILFRVQLPLALATIMAGVNQVIMLALSMVVVAGFVGSGGLGGEVIRAISTLNMSLAVEAGLGVVVIAIFLDRMTEALGQRADRSRGSAST